MTSGPSAVQQSAAAPDVPTPLPAELTARFFQRLADPNRVHLLELLLDGEKSVSQLVELAGLAQNRVSTHLGCLRTCGFVASRRDGRFVYYQVTDPRIRELVQLARRVIAENAMRILSCEVVGAELSRTPAQLAFVSAGASEHQHASQRA